MNTIGIERREEHGSVSPTARLSRGRDTAPQAPQTGLCLNTPGRPPCCPEKKLHACCKDTVLVGVRSVSVPQSWPFTPAIRADRPFLFAIRDVKTGTLLFLGRMTDPTGTAPL